MHDQNGADGELLRRYATRGCEASFAAVVERHAAMVRGVCRRVGAGSGLDPDDVAQVVFATLARRAASLTGLPSVAGWLHRTAWNATSRHRRAAATRGRHERAAGELRAADAVGPLAADAVLDREVIAVEVHRAVNALPEPYHVAVVLHDLQGWTVREVADLIGSPVGTVAARVSRGRQMVRERLDRRGVQLASVLVVAALLAAERDAEAAAGGAADSWPVDGGSHEGQLDASSGSSQMAGATAAALPVAAVTVAAFFGVRATAAGLRRSASTTGAGGASAWGLAGLAAVALAALRSAVAAMFQPAAIVGGLLLFATLGFAGVARHSKFVASSSASASNDNWLPWGGRGSLWTAVLWNDSTASNENKQSPASGQNSAVVPEPGTATVVAAMGLGLFARCRRRTRNDG